MSENNNTNEGENLNGEAKVTVRVNVKKIDAADILAQLGAPVPAIEDLDEIHLIIQKDSVEIKD